MKVYSSISQCSEEWFKLRLGIPTASEFHRLISPKWKVRTGEGVDTYVCEKLAEFWTGEMLPSFSSFTTEQGQLLEAEAIPWFELNYDQTVTRVAFCTTDDGKIGCSPDGLIGDDSGIEIKCPQSPKQVDNLLNGVLPDEYLAQVHGAMFVTGRAEWKFLSYRRRFPPLLVTVQRDEQIQAALKEALDLFLSKFERGLQRLEEINGGPPQHRRRMSQAEINTAWEKAE